MANNKSKQEHIADMLISYHMTNDVAADLIINAISNGFATIEKQDDTSKKIVSIGALHLRNDGELYCSDARHTISNFNNKQMKRIKYAINKHTKNNVTTVTRLKRLMLRTK